MISEPDAPSIARSSAAYAMPRAVHVEQCTYVRTYSQRTTHLDLSSYVSQRAQGVARN